MEEKVVEWRAKQLRDAGYDKISASLIAHSNADYRLAIRMIREGKIDPPLAVKILT